MKTVYENDHVISSHFEGAIELLDWTCDNVNRPKFEEIMNETSRDGDWFGPTDTSAKSIINHALLGNEPLYKMLQKKIDQLNQACGVFTADYTQTIQQAKRIRTRKSVGDELDIHKVYQGKLDQAWTTTERIVADHEHNLVTILVNIGGNYRVKATSSLWRAAAIVKIAGDLERAGKSVQIVVGGITDYTFSNYDKTHTTSIVAKRYNEQLNLERLSAMCYLGFYRVFCFAAKCAVDHELGWGLGSSREFSKYSKKIPAPIQSEIDAGHTRLLCIDKSTSLKEAIEQIHKIEKEVKTF